MYHYYREEVYSGGIYPVNSNLLENQIDQLSRYYTFIGEEDILKWLRADIIPKGNYCLITFDDGLKEQMRAFDYLYERGIPSIYYVPTANLRKGKVLNVHKLHFIRTQFSDVELLREIQRRFDFAKYSLNESQLKSQYKYDSLESAKIKYFLNFSLSPLESEKLINELFAQIVDSELGFSNSLYMNEDDLNKLATAQALGAHGSNHLPLAQLAFKEAKEDVQSSIDYLEQLTGTPIRSFAYPYGGRTAVSNGLHKVFENSSVKFALTTWHGWNNESHLTGSAPFYLNRIDTNDAPGGKNESIEFIPK